MRGEAYLALHEGAKAAVEFEKILDRRGIVVADCMGALHTCNWAGRSRYQESGQGENCLSGFPHALKRRGSRHPDSQASEGGVRQAPA
jgi:hypothetical protein